MKEEASNDASSFWILKKLFVAVVSMRIVIFEFRILKTN
jgi:hypothetical protein